MKSFPIYNEVEACIYKSKKSYGTKNTSKSTIYVGSSKKNSHELATVITTRREKEHIKYGNIIEFAISFEGVILKKMIFKNEKGLASRYISTETKMVKLKSKRV